MIVPGYWAEARLQSRTSERQVTVRRFGWSDVGEAEARAHAELRARDALERILSGERLTRREPKVAYGGAEGVPIREEIVDRHGATVITRNSYGARCLNTPDVLFADIDHDERPKGIVRLVVLLLAAGGSVFLSFGSGVWWAGLVSFLVLAVLHGELAWALERAFAPGDGETRARQEVERFLQAHPDWRVALYRTPAGLRVLALHRRFSPREEEASAFFRAVGADPVYVRMCERQNCFRARLTAKPWRIGIERHLRPRPGVWPVAEDRRAERERWVRDYERIATGYAACEFLEVAGDLTEDPGARAVRDLHDRLSRARSRLPLA